MDNNKGKGACVDMCAHVVTHVQHSDAWKCTERNGRNERTISDTGRIRYTAAKWRSCHLAACTDSLQEKVRVESSTG